MDCQTTTCKCDPCLITNISKENKSEAWSQWYQRDQPYLSNFVRKRLPQAGPVSQVDDIVQESFERAFINVSKKRFVYSGTSLRGYLCGIAKNLLHETYRKGKREVAESPAEYTRADNGRSPEQKLIMHEYITGILAGFQALKPNQQEILFAMYVLGQNSQEVASHYEITRENARITAMRGIKQICQFNQDQYGIDLSSECARSGLAVLPSAFTPMQFARIL